MIEKIVEHLNRTAKLDPSAIRRLVEHRESCNEALSHSGLCITGKDTGFRASIGMLGLLNGLQISKRRIVAHVPDDPREPTTFSTAMPETHPKMFHAND